MERGGESGPADPGYIIYVCLSSPAFPSPRFSGLRYCSTSCSHLHVTVTSIDGTMALSYDSNMSAPYPSLPYPNSIPTSPPLSTSPSPSTTSTTSSPQFPLFTHLPPELRLKIWLLTLPPPRLVPLTYTSITSTSPPSLGGCTSPAAIPVTLHINHESRVLALSYYTLSFGLSGSISTSPSLDPTISPSSSLENKIYFAPARNDILFFGLPTHHATHQQNQQEAIKSFLHACTLVSPTSTGFGTVKRLAVQKSLFTSPSTPYPSPSWIEGGGAGGKTTTLHLRIFWERIRRSFTSVEEVLFVDNPSDALVAFNENDSAFDRNGDEGDGWIGQGSGKSEGLCWPGDELGVWCWERERFGGMVGRVVGCVEGEWGWGWVAPRWRVVGCRMGEEGRGEVEVEARRRKEEGLVRRMRELFGHEGVSNAVC
jgi:hypothetical protein